MIKTGHYIWKRAVLLSALLVLAAIWKQSTAFSGFTLKPCEPSQFAGVLTVQRSAEEYRENVDLIAEGTVLGDGACIELADREAGGRQPMTLYAVHVEKVWYDRGEETGVLNGDVITIHAFPSTRRLANGSRAVFLLEKSQQDGAHSARWTHEYRRQCGFGLYDALSLNADGTVMAGKLPKAVRGENGSLSARELAAFWRAFAEKNT